MDLSALSEEELINLYQEAKARDTPALPDVARALPYSLPKLVTGLAGLPGDVRELAKIGKQKALSYLPSWISAVDAAIPNPVASAAEVLPTSGQLRAAAEQVTGPWYDPQTRIGKVVDTGLQTAATMGRNWVTNPAMAAGLTAAITGGTEGAGALSNDNPWARFIGGVAAGGPVAAVNAMRSRPGTVVKDAIGPMTLPQIGDAIALQDRARALGLPLLGTESLDRGHQLASAVYAHPSGNQALETFMRARPAQVQNAVENELIAQTGARATPAENAARAQQAATDVIGAAERQRTAAVAPYYQAAENEDIPAAAMRPVSNEIQSLIYKNPIGAPADRALGNWYGQLFPSVEPEKLPQVGAPRRIAFGGGVEPTRDDIVTAVRKLGGINPNDERIGSLAQAMPFDPSPVGAVWRKQQFGGNANQSHTLAGHSLDEMTSKLYRLGYVESPNRLDDVLAKLEDASMGTRTHYSTAYEPPSNDPLTNALAQLTEQLKVRNAASLPKLPGTEPAVAPETNVGRLNQLYKNLGVEADTSSIAATPAEKLAAYPARQVQSVLGDVLKQNNANIRAGQEKYAQITGDVIDPLSRGPVGVVAGRAGFNPAEPSPVPRVLSPVADANTARPDTIRTLYTNLNAQDRAAFPGIVQSHLENQLNTALGDLRSGPNPTAGQRFRQAIAGTPQERANFEEMMRGVAQARGADPDAVVAGANNLLTILDRTGRTPGVGSQTALRGDVSKELGKTLIGDTLSTVSLTPTKPLARRFDDWIQRGRYADLAKSLTAPDSVQQLVRLAKLNPNSLSASYLAASLLGFDRAISVDQLPQRR